MPIKFKIKQTVQFTEQTTIPKEQSENALFDILQEEVADNTAYCQALINIWLLFTIYFFVFPQ